MKYIEAAKLLLIKDTNEKVLSAVCLLFTSLSIGPHVLPLIYPIIAVSTALTHPRFAPLHQKGKCLLSTIPENGDLLNKLLGAGPQVFQPSIPNLIYQYNFFVNYDSERLSHVNEEIALHADGKKGCKNLF